MPGEDKPSSAFPATRHPPPPPRSGGALLIVSAILVVVLLAGGSLVYWWYLEADQQARENAQARDDAEAKAKRVQDEQAKVAEDARQALEEERAQRKFAEDRLPQLEADLKEANRRRDKAEDARRAADKFANALKDAEARAQKELLKLREDSAALAYIDQVNLADWELREGSVYQAEIYLQRAAPRLRRWEWSYLNRLASAEVLLAAFHTDAIMGVAFSPDGKRLASGSRDRFVKVIDAATGKLLVTCQGHLHPVHAVAFSRDGKRLASCGGDIGEQPMGEIKIWDADTGKELLELKGHLALVTAVAFNPAGDRLASASWDGTVRVWDTSSRKDLVVFKGHNKRVFSVAFSPDGKQVASCSDAPAPGMGGDVKLWDAETGKEIASLRGHRTAVLGVAYQPDGKWLASAGADGTVRTWDAAARGVTAPLRTIPISQKAVQAVAFGAGKRLFASTDGVIHVWDLEKQQWVRGLRGHKGLVLAVAASPDGRLVASAGADRSVRVWDLMPVPSSLQLPAHEGIITAILFSPDGKRLATAGADKVVRLWDVAAGAADVKLTGFASPVIQLAFSPDGKRLVTVSAPVVGAKEAEVKVWDSTGKEIVRIPGMPGGPVSVAFAPEGDRLLLAAPGGSLKIVNAMTGKEVARLEGTNSPPPGTAVDCLAGSADGRRLALAWQDTITVLTRAPDSDEWISQDWKDPTFKDQNLVVRGLAWGPDNNLLAADLGQERVKMWNARLGQSPGVWIGTHLNARGVGFSLDGSRLFTPGPPPTLRIWELPTKRTIMHLRGHTSPIAGIAVSPDGRRVAAGSENGTVVIWDATSRRVFASPQGG